MEREKHLAIVGSYSQAKSEGIHSLMVDCQTGKMELLDSITAGPDPIYLAIRPNSGYFYAVINDENGIVQSFKIDDSGNLEPLNRVHSGSVSPCYCSIDKSGKYLLVAHYTGGVVSTLPIEPNGTIGEPVSIIEHSGSSIHPERQCAPHPHSIVPGPRNRFVYVPDLGTDQIVIYEFDGNSGMLKSCDSIDTKPGAGPRHIEFGPKGDTAYLINELDSTLTMFRYEKNGLLTELSTVSTLPIEYQKDNSTADVHVYPTEEYVYGSNRGHDSIAVFAIRSSELSPIDHTLTGGEWPRDFTIDPTGQYLFAENRHTDNITSFCIDADSGTLSRTGEHISISQPVCMKWVH